MFGLSIIYRRLFCHLKHHGKETCFCSFSIPIVIQMLFVCLFFRWWSVIDEFFRGYISQNHVVIRHDDMRPHEISRSILVRDIWHFSSWSVYLLREWGAYSAAARWNGDAGVFGIDWRRWGDSAPACEIALPALSAAPAVPRGVYRSSWLISRNIVPCLK